MADTVRLGIIGLGQQGGMYAKLISEGRVPHMTIGAICDTDPAKRDAVRATYPGVAVHEDWRAMLASGDVDAVVTTVPHFLHPEMGIAALEAGIHALVEKPAGVYTRQANELIEFAATKPELTFGIMFNQRMNPLYQRLKEIVENGEIGRIRRSNWIITTWWRPQGYYDSSAWRATWGGEGGGVLVNQAPHQLDLWQWICGVPEKVYAKLGYGVNRDIAVENDVTAFVEYADGATGTFVTCTYDIDGTDRFEILGDQGKIVVEGSKRAIVTRLRKPEAELSASMDMDDVMKLFMGGVDFDTLYTQETIELESPFGQQHSDVLENFALNILDGTPLIAPGADGINGVRLANAIHLSDWTGQEVPLQFDDQQYLDLLNARIRDEGTFPVRPA
ncbi:Gfo/Idh/MocA family oxidoreductase [Cellulomonas sp. ATA003]|uniref:Gfo/Idh/MocA family protein n=1 Tax=Cellulomonas sp. ATA003 TaxID=3073064 RepID=UPI002872FFE6|nr:Gfo/Idh/MocA family oxidoreductase [Cellulomonas sp. ATA003]WNB87234.1 Gfo/Idh/MocA family oxidoreductase [Cellulomonas sp. ATA003]